ncbi:MAG: TM0106 family RecB-like putative nuclease [Cyclobacteriaceae bacterium]|nr:TM0106 family RecB-like putative nuclease [Cyclobacteriaceae bacterium]
MQYLNKQFELAATDLSNHIGCAHLTQLNRKAARKELDKPNWYDPSLQVLMIRGQEHEDAYVKHLIDQGLNVINLKGQPTTQVVDAMKEGVDIIVQAMLQSNLWIGHADILIKVPGKSRFGNWSYEVQDTKLSQTTRAVTILQLSLYTELVGELQGTVPLRMWVVKPGRDFPKDDYFFHDYQAYYRSVKKNFELIMSGSDLETYPEPVPQCSICKWWVVCDKKRHADDHLSLVAGIRTLHIQELHKQTIQTLEGFAITDDIKIPLRGNRETFLKKQKQAKIQLKGRIEKSLLYESLPIEDERGFNRLPEPNMGDLYFDIEGDPYFPDGGLEYILGYTKKNASGVLEYKNHWATNKLQEKQAFMEFMEFVIGQWKKYPKFHIYHFAAYDPSAVKRLASVHAVYEQDVDQLLRENKFVDLHAIVKEALLASVEHYSLKTLEELTPYKRKIDLPIASIARKNVECALELNEVNKLAKETLNTVTEYNEDDCRATGALHQWLEEFRTTLIDKGIPFKRPLPRQPEPDPELTQMENRAKAIFTDLLKKLPEDRTNWSPEHKSLWLLAHQVDYFRRENKSAWWEYFRVHSMDYEELIGERSAIAGLEFVKSLPIKPSESMPLHQYKYPSQEVGLKKGDRLVEVNVHSDDDKTIKVIGTVESISLENETVNIKKTEESKDIHPTAVHEYDIISPKVLWRAVMDVAAEIDENGFVREFKYHAAKDLLMKRSPVLQNNESVIEISKNQSAADAAIQIALKLNKSILPIQGPPGSGKTTTGARMIIALHKAGKKIGVTAISHRVITTLFEKVHELAAKENYPISFTHKVTNKISDMPSWVNQVIDGKKIPQAIQNNHVVGGTAWLWASIVLNENIDYLFIDEAGQMALTQALAVSKPVKNLILLGDPQQLEQPQRGAHPEGSDVAALTYLMDGNQTIPVDRGIFLSITHRIHPAIAEFTSEIFYEGKLSAAPGLEKQRISGGTQFDGAGLFYVPSNHIGNQNYAEEEVTQIVKIVANLLKTGKWTDTNDKTRALNKEDILIVAPYNIQVAALSEKLPDIAVGTVDKFQGREKPVVIYSMTSSSAEDAPRGMNFLYTMNRLNVATSRAKATCILVANPAIFEPQCKTLHQMKLANALCRYKELAKVVAIS